MKYIKKYKLFESLSHLESFQKENGFVTVLDDDGMITIQMTDDSLIKIINTFDNYIDSKTDHKEKVEVSEFGEIFELELSLRNEGGGFHLTGSRVDTENFYHNFELEYCDIETWYKIKELCLS